MANEFLYKINIPPFIDIARDDWKHNLNWNSLKKLPAVIPANVLIQDHYLNFNNIEWKNIVRLPLNPTIETFIHSDNSGDSIDPNLENPKMIWFAINFVLSGSGRMDYYLPSQLDPEPFSDPNDPYQQKNWTTKQQPYKSYEMTTGAYLVNATIPHRATAYNERIVLSVRPNRMGEQGKHLWGKNWDGIVDMFKEYIDE